MDMIKKIAIGAFVAVMFVIYSINQRNSSAEPAVDTAKKSTLSVASAVSTSPSPSSSPSAVASSGTYKDGDYTGTREDALYGYIRVKATISGGKLSDVTFLEYPNDQPNSLAISKQAMPILKSEAISIQSAHVDGVSGATDSVNAFIKSLGDALSQAQA
jgi:uncharacterized protein with FMN-binding domain